MVFCNNHKLQRYIKYVYFEINEVKQACTENLNQWRFSTGYW